MSTENFSVLICRGAAVILLVLSLSFILTALLFGLHSGWTSYALMGRDQLELPRRVVLFLRANFPYLVQATAGVLLWLFSRSCGRLLAHGLSLLA